jgi:protocatechuate 3,4-dioxygenase beta subunit
LRQKGDLKRCDIYSAYDFSHRPDAPPSLYPLVKNAWPNLTIQRILEIADANALQTRMLFDGQRTRRWRRVDGQLVADEHGADQFKILQGPVPHSLTGLIWPNLHLRLQSGSSQFKRDVRLLPNDPNRPGLVGLQFVEFAAREDYWFDPAKDYMQIERVRKQEGRGVTSRSFIVETAQTTDGRWYPSALEIAFSNPNSADPTTVRRQELRVLVDASPIFGDGVFLVDASETETWGSDVPSAETEPASKTRANQVMEQPEPVESPAGTVRDERGDPVADAAVLLYHNRSRWGLGNEVLEQVQTDVDGRYAMATPVSFERTTQHAYAQDSYVLLAWHADYAFAWRNIDRGPNKQTYDLTLTTPTSRTVTATDHEGNPLPGVRVWLYHAGDRKSHSPLFRDYLSLPTDVGLIGGTTDAGGVVTVTNLPETDCSFHATLEDYATGLAFPGQDRIRLSPGANVSGWVLTESGQPISGAIVAFKTKWMHNYFLAESDGEGRFTFGDLPARGWDRSPWGNKEGADGAYTVALEHDDCAAPETDIELLPGQAIDDLVITASGESALVRCLVLEEGTDAPVAGARIWGKSEFGSINGYSDANGVFTVRVLPGPVWLSFHSPPDGVYVVEGEGSADYRVKFDATPGQMDVTLRAPPTRGRLVTVRGALYDTGGVPVSNAVVYAAAGRFDPATTGSIRPAGADTSGRFELKEVPAGRDLHVYVESKDRMLALADGFYVPADPDELEPVELVLLSTATAATVIQDAAGNPVADTNLSVSPMVQGERIWRAKRRGRTDHLGILKIDGIIPGLSYHLRDARFDAGTGQWPEGWRSWFDGEVTLIPLDQ